MDPIPRPTATPLTFPLLLAWVGLVFLAPASAAPPRPKQDEHDLEVTLYARLALSQDETLDRLNLSVRVVLGVASVEGPVPSKEVGERAVAILKKVRGVYSVRPCFRLEGSVGEDAVKDVQKGAKTGSVPNDLPPSLLSSGLEDSGTGLLGALRGHPTERQPEQSYSAHSELPGRERDDYRPQPAYVPGPSVSLGAPVARPAPATRTDVAATLLVPRASVPGRTVSQPVRVAPDLAAAVERLRTADDNFRNLHIDVRDGIVTVRGPAAREQLMRLARSLSRLPGVREVNLP